MEETIPLHAQKVAILSRLMKENTSLTLEESLLLLKDETDEDNQMLDNQQHMNGYLKLRTNGVDVQPFSGYPGVLKYNPFRYSTTSTSTDTTLTISGDSLETNTDIEHANL